MRGVSEVACVRCGNTRAAAENVALPGALGERIRRQVCDECWKEWLTMQIRVINHYGLRPVLREDREKLYELTREYFGLPAEPAPTPPPS